MQLARPAGGPGRRLPAFGGCRMGPVSHAGGADRPDGGAQAVHRLRHLRGHPAPGGHRRGPRPWWPSTPIRMRPSSGSAHYAVVGDCVEVLKAAAGPAARSPGARAESDEKAGKLQRLAPSFSYSGACCIASGYVQKLVPRYMGGQLHGAPGSAPLRQSTFPSHPGTARCRPCLLKGRVTKALTFLPHLRVGVGVQVHPGRCAGRWRLQPAGHRAAQAAAAGAAAERADELEAFRAGARTGIRSCQAARKMDSAQLLLWPM